MFQRRSHAGSRPWPSPLVAALQPALSKQPLGYEQTDGRTAYQASWPLSGGLLPLRSSTLPVAVPDVPCLSPVPPAGPLAPPRLARNLTKHSPRTIS
jgi:hypothetical protein